MPAPEMTGRAVREMQVITIDDDDDDCVIIDNPADARKQSHHEKVRIQKIVNPSPLLRVSARPSIIDLTASPSTNQGKSLSKKSHARQVHSPSHKPAGSLPSKLPRPLPATLSQSPILAGGLAVSKIEGPTAGRKNGTAAVYKKKLTLQAHQMATASKFSGAKISAAKSWLTGSSRGQRSEKKKYASSKNLSDSSLKVWPLRNKPLAPPYRFLDSAQLKGGEKIMPGMFIELIDGEFLQIKSIAGNSDSNEAILRGYRLQRCSSMNGMLEKKLNELCFFHEVDLDDPRPLLEQSVCEFSIAQVKKIRNVRLTNQKFPLDRNFNNSDFGSQLDAAQNGGLTARWKYICTYKSAAQRYGNEFHDRAFEHVRADEVQGPVTSSDAALRETWRGETIIGGSYLPFTHSQEHVPPVTRYEPKTTKDTDTAQRSNMSQALVPTSQKPAKRKLLAVDTPQKRICYVTERALKGVKVIVLEDCEIIDASQLPAPPTSQPAKNTRNDSPRFTPADTPIARQPSRSQTRAPGQMFTYGDAFCGTGGTTRGALLANLKIKWGFDFNAQACVSWKSNFPDADNYELHSSEFVQTARKLIEAGAQAKFKVDILHLSPPCQFFSVAHSVMGKNDEHNSASLFAVRDVIEVATPRVVTLEQAFGIVRPQFMWYLAALIQMFTSLGFSLRWALVHFEDWGLPQRRKRLIMIASCPGEPLPRLPAPTHSATGMHGLKLYATVNATLAQIPHGAPKHNPSELHAQDYKPWDGDAILPRSMTCAGGQNWHPSGRRDFTECEYAALQGFPPGHIFKGSYVRKQIGNAVPPSVARVLFESVKRDLCVADGIVDEPEIMVVD